MRIEKYISIEILEKTVVEMPKRNAFEALVSGSKKLSKKLIKCPNCGKEINWTHSGWASHWREQHPSEKRPPLKRQQRSELRKEKRKARRKKNLEKRRNVQIQQRKR